MKPLRCRAVAAYRSIGGTVGGCGQILALRSRAPGDPARAWAYDLLMRILLRSAVALAALVLGCAGPGPRPVEERPVGYAQPEPDPACRTLVTNTMALNGIEKVTVRVAVGGDRSAVDLLAPELTPAAAADVQRAFAQCVWRPGAGGATTGTVTFTRR